MLFALLNILDLVTTHLGGLHNEINPVAQILLARHGLMGLASGKALLVIYFMASTALMRRMGFRLLEIVYRKLMIGIYLVVLAWNVRYLVLR